VSEGATDEVLESLRNRVLEGDVVAVYENAAMDSKMHGHRVYMIIGPTRTHTTAPKRAPDGEYGMGWRYPLKGLLNLQTNTIEPEQKGAADG
jgi:hypothetical protein